MKRAPPATPAPPQCPQCTTPTLCKTPAWREKAGVNCKGRAIGIDNCDCLIWCGDDPWVKDGRSRGCSRYYQENPACKPQPIYLAVYCSTDLVVGPFSPLPYDWM